MRSSVDDITRHPPALILYTLDAASGASQWLFRVGEITERTRFMAARRRRGGDASAAAILCREVARKTAGPTFCGRSRTAYPVGSSGVPRPRHGAQLRLPGR